MLKELQLTNFKSFAGQCDPIPLAPVTILVGANASGKSNVFDAIRFLQGIGMGLSIAEILTGKWQGGRETFPPLRGGTEEVCHSGQNRFTIRSTLNLTAEARIVEDSAGHQRLKAAWRLLEHEMTCEAKRSPAVAAESLTVDGQLRLHFPKDPSESDVLWPRSLLWEDRRHIELDQASRSLIWRLRGEYARLQILQLRPSEMQAYVPVTAPELGSEGHNLSAIVYQICQDADQKERYLSWLTALCAPRVSDIQFQPNVSDEVLLHLEERNGGKRYVSARSLSDGTLRFMGVLAALLSAPEGSLFLLEEIENGLHPTRVHLLVELLEQVAESRMLQIIGTTHSPQVLLGLSEETLRSAVLFARPEETTGTITRRLGDLPHFEEVTQKAQIDRLFATGWLEQAL